MMNTRLVIGDRLLTGDGATDDLLELAHGEDRRGLHDLRARGYTAVRPATIEL